ncbi:hypothetical protein ZOD2009_06529 [Haladaptatus paucihalophilus DX253]|uniref:Uncharacterized protein n=1 Tax=Haladaptatus paucihalophilus DX253 TaxID=797209 RepID=E7QR83_HALPU|nr:MULTISPECIES: hypothetical protein [Haladaptatus]EFW92991.1 hypothetical protein ZOD2009_06529 [Haladaptatus paucihalophilus DX253]SHL17372.1 hypothetical protein SAMN05444342_3130 [Haladaptatus paucihalophilus DX253]
MKINSLSERVKSNPRLLGVLFAATLILLQVQCVAANFADISPGP